MSTTIDNYGDALTTTSYTVVLDSEPVAAVSISHACMDFKRRFFGFQR